MKEASNRNCINEMDRRKSNGIFVLDVCRHKFVCTELFKFVGIEMLHRKQSESSCFPFFFIFLSRFLILNLDLSFITLKQADVCCLTQCEIELLRLWNWTKVRFNEMKFTETKWKEREKEKETTTTITIIRRAAMYNKIVQMRTTRININAPYNYNQCNLQYNQKKKKIVHSLQTTEIVINDPVPCT